MKEKDLTEVKMDLVMRSQGGGYLKVPSEVRNILRSQFGMEVKDLVNNKLLYELDGDEGSLKLIYEFDLSKNYEGEYAKDEYV